MQVVSIELTSIISSFCCWIHVFEVNIIDKFERKNSGDDTASSRIDQNYFPVSKNRLAKLKVEFSASFGRQLEYYTGMVFNIKDQFNTNLIQGGRYDNLLSNLGSKTKIPAVGAAINLNSYDN